MSGLLERWNRYWYRPAPVLDLAIVRLLVVGLHQLLLIAPYSLVTVPLYEEFDLFVALPAEHYQPIAIFRWLTLPLGAGYRPTVEHLEFARWATLGVGFTALLGLFTRTSLALYTLGFAFMISHRYSYGDYHHLETVPVLTLAVLACAPAGHALSLDAWQRNRRRSPPLAPLLQRTDPDAAWPGRLMAWLLSLIYFSAAISKLGGGGLEWMNGFTVQASLLQAACFWSNPEGLALAHHHGLMHVLTWFTVLFEGLFFLILVRPRWAPGFALVAIAFHAGSMYTMNVPFGLYLPCFAILLPWTAWIRRLRGLPPLPSSDVRV